MAYKPLVTIIIATYNVASSLEKTIQSVLSQTYSHIELIIIDGDSTDGTKELIEQYQKHISYWVSERDRGISDAFNKGIQKATGTYINFQGAGDVFVSDDVIERMMSDISSEDDMLVCGRVERVDAEGSVLLTTKPTFTKWSLLLRMSLPHQALFTHARFFEEYGLFDLNNRYCMDYELLLRAYKTFPAVIMKDIVVSYWRDGGIGTGRLKEVYHEYDAIKRMHHVAPRILLFLIDKWILSKLLIKRLLT